MSNIEKFNVIESINGERNKFEHQHESIEFSFDSSQILSRRLSVSKTNSFVDIDFVSLLFDGKYQRFHLDDTVALPFENILTNIFNWRVVFANKFV